MFRCWVAVHPLEARTRDCASVRLERKPEAIGEARKSGTFREWFMQKNPWATLRKMLLKTRARRRPTNLLTLENDNIPMESTIREL